MEDEKRLTESAFLVSETDEHGIITFANDDFCEIAGYKREELLGKPHNIVRHPDMPKAAFKDLWHTVKSGKIWTGFVKNKVKGGGYYWVYATVYPVVSCDRKKGYMSCRRMATRDEIQKAEELYKTMK
ncbi:MAG: PAS domain-containing protein [Campylobacterales bacterium]|nr:PAS domain-containing protein [Campylobacterales bacterium]